MARFSSVPARFYRLAWLCTLAVLFSVCAHLITHATCGTLDLIAVNGNATTDGLTDSHAEGSDLVDDSALSATISIVQIRPVIFPLPVLSLAARVWCCTPPVHPPIISNAI